VKAHVGIDGNEAADEAAKQAATCRKAPTYNLFPPSYPKLINRKKAREEHEKLYREATIGSMTRYWFENLDQIEKYRQASDHTATHETTQFFSNHGQHRAYLHRFKLTQGEDCPCGAPAQTIPHLFDECPMYAIERNLHFGPCDQAGFKPRELKSYLHLPDLVKSFNNFVTSIAGTLKTYNTGLL